MYTDVCLCVFTYLPTLTCKNTTVAQTNRTPTSCTGWLVRALTRQCYKHKSREHAWTEPRRKNPDRFGSCSLRFSDLIMLDFDVSEESIQLPLTVKNLHTALQSPSDYMFLKISLQLLDQHLLTDKLKQITSLAEVRTQLLLPTHKNSTVCEQLLSGTLS